MLDCRPADRRKPADVAKFDATAADQLQAGPVGDQVFEAMPRPASALAAVPTRLGMR
jgi:hypothetical protein